MSGESRHPSFIQRAHDPEGLAIEMQPAIPSFSIPNTGAPQPAADADKYFRFPNPLAPLSRREVLEEVEQFLIAKDLTKFRRLFKTAALVAHNPMEYESINALICADPAQYDSVRPLEEEELEALRNESIKRFKHPRELYLTIALCSVGAAVQGWDQTGANGANLFFPAALGIPTSQQRYPDRNAWLVGLINAIPYLTAAFPGCWLSDPLNFYLGRRGTIFLAAIFCLVPGIGSAFSQTWEQLLVCRLLLGIGMGVKATTVPIFAAENSPASIRGALVMSWQMWVSFGIFLGMSTNLIVRKSGEIVWRLQLGSVFILAVPLLLGIYFCPESPRWYMKKKRYQAAFASLRRLRNTDIQAARDLFYMHSQLKDELRLQEGKGYFTRLMGLFMEKRNRTATLASFTVMIAQQLCGTNIMAFYSSTVFRDAGASDEAALWASWGYGLAEFLFAFLALRIIDSLGRRTLLLITFPQMAWTLLAAGFCSLIKAQTVHVVLVEFFVFLFAAVYSVGEGPVPFTYSAEVFPLSHRELGMGFAVATNLFWAAVLSVTFPRMLAVMGAFGAFAFYAGLNVLAFIMIFLVMPETKQRTLEDLDHIFSVSTKEFAHYQVTETIPYCVKRCVHPRGPDTRAQLYPWS
ncbi:MAG: hypothetical protein M1830_010240 [Pleopsidium flavum]|nr:MAG: hypothetical protein M1830_010240 [Pleopsidium flavum]